MIFRPSSRLAPLLMPLTLLAVAQLAAAQLQLSQNFDSGSLNVATSSITATANPAQPLIALDPRRTWNNQHWWVSFSLDGATAMQPKFEVPTSGAFQSYSSAHRYVYSYDGENWSFFTNGGIANGKYWFQNSTVFTTNQVYIAYGLPYSMDRTGAWVSQVNASPWVTPTATANANLVVGQTLGTAGGGYNDSSGRSVDSQNLYGLRITDPAATGPKAKIVMIGGNHSGEPTGSHALQGMVDFVLSNDPRAVQLRKVAEFYVYPQTDPEGRAAGYYRSNPQNPADNHNRQWSNPTGFTELEILQASMRADTGADIDYFFDFHSYGSATSYKLNLPNADRTSDYVLALLEINGMPLAAAETDPGTARGWATMAGGLNADFSFTPEFGFLPGWQAADYQQIGADYALALHAVLAPEPTSCAILLASCAAGLLRRTRRPGRAALGLGVFRP
ncbi:MAG: M14 family zinc carboxypeptidase [Phycisphaeraceae bacterium]